MKAISACLFAILVLPALAGVASAEPVQVGQTLSLKIPIAGGQTIDTEQLKGKLVVLDFWASWCEPCMEYVPHMVDINQKYGSKGLQIIGINMDQNRGDMTRVTQSRQMTWPEYFDGLVWKNKIAQQFSVQAIPYTLLLSPEGKVLFAGIPATGLEQAIEKAFRDDPPGMVDPAILAAAGKQMDEVDQKIKEGDTQAALRLLSDVPPAAMGNSKFAERAKNTAKQLEAAAKTMLDDVQKQIDAKQYVQAVAHLRDLSAALKGLPEAADAKKMLSSLNSNPDAVAAMQQVERGRKADDAIAAADALKAEGKDAAAYDRYKTIAAAYPGTDAGSRAKQQVQTYEKDPAFVKSVLARRGEDAARAALSMAANYKAAGRTDKAREKYQSVIDQFPNTPFADEAKQGLQSLNQ